jgi:hypothetical protein
MMEGELPTAPRHALDNRNNGYRQKKGNFFFAKASFVI